jgi:hypothetical protein
VSFISPSDHEKLIRIFQSSIDSGNDGSAIDIGDEKANSLRKDIDLLKQIAEQYKDTLAQLQELGRQYKVILQRTKVNMRKQQIKVNRNRNKKTVFSR